MYMRYTSAFLALITLLFLSFSSIYAQGDNDPDPLVNLALIDGAVVSGSVAEEDAGGKLPGDILWDPSTGDYAQASTWHEYGQAFSLAQGGITKENPMWWKVEWPTEKNVNYITVSGVYGNQPQPTTGWAVQVMVDDEWQDLSRANNSWPDDTLRGVGVGVQTQTSWPWDGQMVWRGLEPVVTKGIRFTIYASPDSLADSVATAADSVISFSWTGREMEGHKACLIQYIDFSGEEADNDADAMVNLGLLEEAVMSASFTADMFDNERGTPYSILYDNYRGDYSNRNTAWGEFGYGFQYEVGFPEEGQYSDPPAIDDAFYWQAEWPVPKNINFLTWGGVYGNQLQPDAPWALKYWDGASWVTLMDGIGGTFAEGDTMWPYTPGIDDGAWSIWNPHGDIEAIQTTKIRLEVWSDGVAPLWSYHIRARGGNSISSLDGVGHDNTPFKAVLIGYGDYTTVGVEAAELVRPEKFALYQNYPNPFNPSTKIDFTLDQQQDVRLSVYNLLGQEVKVLVNGVRAAGQHTVNFDASELSGGVYFYRLQTNQTMLTKKMVFIK